MSCDLEHMKTAEKDVAEREEELMEQADRILQERLEEPPARGEE